MDALYNQIFAGAIYYYACEIRKYCFWARENRVATNHRVIYLRKAKSLAAECRKMKRDFQGK